MCVVAAQHRHGSLPPLAAMEKGAAEENAAMPKQATAEELEARAAPALPGAVNAMKGQG